MQYNFQNLVFEGGGVKGIAYGGALEKLEQKGILSNIKRVAGTSAGAINATLLALGFSHKEVSDVIANTNFKTFEDKSGWFVPEITRFFKTYGWYRGKKFLDWMGDLIGEKTGEQNFTFKDLHKNITNGKAGFRDLYIVATNLSKQKYILFSYKTTPDVPIREAVRMSMSIPLYFQAFPYKKDIMADGGVAYNYPVNLFDHVEFLSNPENGDQVSYSQKQGYCFNHETLGFRLDSTQVINYALDDWSLQPVEISGIKGYCTGLISFMMEMANKRHLHQNDWNRTIFIDTLDVMTTDFDLKPVKIEALIESGRKGVVKYFEWRDKDPEWGTKPAMPVEVN
ncbi:MAG: patatin-like phospholipase family protein [Candidatus Cyclobacteriaceae bacterium M2_1C_046]